MAEKKKILIVEDEVSILAALEYRFKSFGFEVVLAQDGEDGLSKAISEKPDIIILDLSLPKLTGEAVCKEIRNDNNIAKTPIIMLTAKDSDADRVIGRVIGADCYITKPFDLERLRREVEKLLK